MTVLPGSSYSTEYIIQRCFPNVPNLFERLTYETLPLPNSKSFWSLITRIVLKWHNEEDRERYPSSLFLKLPTLSENVTMIESQDVDSLSTTLASYTESELLFYRMLKNRTINGFRYPHFFHGEAINEKEGCEGCIVLEDLSGNCKSVDYIPGFSIHQVNALAEALASWHAFLFHHPEFVQPFVDFKGIDDELQDMLYTECLKLEKIFPDWFEGLISPLKKYFSTQYACDAFRSYQEFKIPPVLVHMDMNTTNVIWKKDTIDSTNPEIGAIIDFQQLHGGNICEDIARILQTGVPVDVRRRSEEQVLESYHRKLTELLGERTPVTFDQVRACYGRVFICVANFSLFSVVCYHAMYEHDNNEQNEELRKEKQMELLRRAKGIVEDINNFIEK